MFLVECGVLEHGVDNPGPVGRRVGVAGTHQQRHLALQGTDSRLVLNTPRDPQFGPETIYHRPRRYLGTPWALFLLFLPLCIHFTLLLPILIIPLCFLVKHCCQFSIPPPRLPIASGEIPPQPLYTSPFFFHISPFFTALHLHYINIVISTYIKKSLLFKSSLTLTTTVRFPALSS
jgi:hypothetical protein